MRTLFAVATLVVLAEAQVGRPSNPETAAIAALRAINSGQAAYSAMCAGGGYAVELADLRKPRFGDHHGFVSPNLDVNGVVLQGTYVVTVEKDAAEGVGDIGSPERTCNGSQYQPVSSYYASATPLTPGLRYFATDTRGTVFASNRPIVNPIRTGTPLH